MRKTLVIILLALLPPLAWGQDHTRPKVAVVLSGGGAKGVAHISALRAIEQAGIPIDIITGTSMGSLIGGLYAIGWTTDQLDSLVRTQDWTFLLTDRARPEALDIDSRRLQNTYPLWHAFTIGTQRNEGAGVIRGLNLDHLFDRLLAPYLDSISFDSLPIPFACVATDVVTNTEIDFHSGFLKQAMRASMSIPGVFTPVRWGNHLLVDGGLRNNYPADIARQMGADIVIGVTVQGDTLTADDITGPIDLFMQIIDINCKNKYAANIAMSDLVIPVDVSGYSAASFTPEAIDTLLRRGSEAAERYRSQLQAIGQRFSPEAADQTSPVAAPRLPRAQIHSPRSTLHSESPLLTSPIVGVTFRFDNEETGALQIGAQLPFVWHFPMQVSARLRLGKRMQFSAEHKIYPRGITSPSIKYSYQRNDIDLYKNGIRTYNIKNNQHTFHLTPLNSLFRRYKLRAGIRFDYYDYYDPILSSGSNAIVLDNQHFFSYFFESLLNTEDLFYFPTSGTLFLATFAYRTDNLATLNGSSGIPDLSFLWRINLSPLPGITFQPSVFSRMLLGGSEVPLAFVNILGAEQTIVEQQIHFPGVHSLVMSERILLGAMFTSQHLIARNQYILLRAAAARHLDDINTFFHSDIDFAGSEFIYGVSVGYAYSSFLGPIQAHIGYSSLAPGVNLYVSIGHLF